MIDAIRIISPDLGVSDGTKVFSSDGNEIKGVSKITVTIAPNDFVRAEVEVCVADFDAMALPLLGLDTLKASAAHHGFRLVPINEEDDTE